MPKKRPASAHAASAAKISQTISLTKEEKEKIDLFLSSQASAEDDKKFLSENTGLREKALNMLSPRRVDSGSLILGLRFLEGLVIKGFREELLPQIAADKEKVSALLDLLNQNCSAVGSEGKIIANLSLAFLVELSDLNPQILHSQTILPNLLALLDRAYEDKGVVLSSKDLIAQNNTVFLLSKRLKSDMLLSDKLQTLLKIGGHENILHKLLTLLGGAFEFAAVDANDAITNDSIINNAAALFISLVNSQSKLGESLDKTDQVYQGIIPNLLKSLSHYCVSRDEDRCKNFSHLALLFMAYDPELLPQIVANPGIAPSNELLKEILKAGKYLATSLKNAATKVDKNPNSSIDAKFGLLSFVATLASDESFYESLKENPELTGLLGKILHDPAMLEVEQIRGALKKGGEKDFKTEGLEHPCLPKLISLLQAEISKKEEAREKDYATQDLKEWLSAPTVLKKNQQSGLPQESKVYMPSAAPLDADRHQESHHKK